MNYAIASVYGSTPVPEAIERCLQLAEQSSGDQIPFVTINLQLAQLYAMRGEFDRARSLSSGARAKLDELRLGIGGAHTSIDTARVATLAGDHATAERELRADYDALTALGEQYYVHTVGGMLARSVQAQGRDDEAEELALRVRNRAASDDADAQALWRSVLMRILVGRADLDEALVLAREAVEIRSQTDSPVDVAEAQADLAAVLRDAGRFAEADASLEIALELVRLKGDLVTAERLTTERAAWVAAGNV